MKPLLITGGNGFIGYHLTRYLLRAGYDVHVTVRHRSESPVCPEHIWDGCDVPHLADLSETICPRQVIHLVAEAKPTRTLEDMGAQFHNTLLPAFAVAKAIPSSTELALFFGSCEEYGDGPTPHNEEQKLRAISPYGWAKISAYYGAVVAANLRNIPWCWARPYLAFGPRQKCDRLIPHVISECLRNAEIVLSPGGQTRDFIFVDAVCEMVQRILAAPDRAVGQVVNLCSGQPRTIKSVAEQICGMIGRGNLGFGTIPYRPNEAMSFYGSTAKFDRLFGPCNPLPFEEALERTIDAYRQEIAAKCSIRHAHV